MTAAHEQRDWDQIRFATWQKFVVRPTVACKGSQRNKFREKRQQQVQAAFDKFRDAIESGSPPQSKDEAVRQVLGLIRQALGVLSWFFPQYALLISVIGFLWDVSRGSVDNLESEEG